MKAKLIKKDDDYFLEVEFWYPKYIQPSIIANTFVKPKGEVYDLCRKNCDEIFGVVDVNKLATQHLIDKNCVSLHTSWQGYNENTYKEGFNKAMELNKDKVFTLEDVESAMRCMISQEIFYGETHEETQQMRQTYIKSYIDFLAKEPTEIEVEVEMELNMNGKNAIDRSVYIPKLDSEGCLILKKI